MHKMFKQFGQLTLHSANKLPTTATTTLLATCKILSPVTAPLLSNGKDLHTAASAGGTGALCSKWNKHNHGPRKWLENNKTVHPPQEVDEEPRKAYVCHMRTNIKYSPDKMWYIAAFVRGMSVDEALKQLNFVLKKGATDVKETILEAQEMAVQRHNVEYKSNLWIAESFVGKGRVFKGIRRHGRGRFGRVEYKHCHYFVRLEEGEPPEHYYLPEQQTPQQQYDHWQEQMRSRKIINSL
ncbi:39S ribosomal protein L22, mitochondrial [Scaptodrosophila lebanonensis]|uniref:Large ribosomal subunit protein uL22m n=1 Tax=Drosophila lebanonensis TaxID=7225 RepID=A0A6J2U0J1_DROLE|nr:39S ribosomal protein L22, mitochondrial [Scaptodrosophila lebanonensis]